MRDLGAAEPLDHFAVLAQQEYNLGNVKNWFFSFRGGLFGLVSRLRGLIRHSRSLHKWSYSETIYDHEHHVSVMLFCMDSALEHYVFMLNALGQAVDVSAFRDVGDDRALRGISPKDILGNGRDKPRPGYQTIFPKVSTLWNNRVELIRMITENHDVTKHRHQAMVSGQVRQDPPEGFFHRAGMPDDLQHRVFFSPMAEVFLGSHPKLPIGQTPVEPTERSTLEKVEQEFHELINDSLLLAEKDARSNIKLNEYEFRH
jgi:hypothetical protein